MAKKEVTVTFKTITPLWTGDAWQNNREIRPSSLIGSLRFWFETIMYFADILKKEDFNSQSGRFEKEVDRKRLREFIKKYGNNINEIIKHFIDEQQIPISSVIFGTTNWMSLIEIKDIEFDENKFQGEPKGKIIPNKNWYFGTPSYQGEFEVRFKVEEEILNSLFYPLLTFMDKYGFWGGKWNIGYGRLKVESVNGKKKEEWKVEKLDLQTFNINKVIYFNESEKNNSFSVLKNVTNFNDLTQFNNKNKKIKILKNQISNNDLNELIKKLIKLKAQERSNFKNNKELRHKIFGKTGNPRNLPYVPQGSKILPYIYEEQRQLKGGFLSIAGLLNLEGESDE
ncbi:RAMP superfamily CRISPR-associated protein [Persephonella sp. IF05-L8]|uniref:RAMP superfamily CRISPR-associated protein n=1 Tax=Persephonella sp. IF05-L8 TaxID=1158338 RepID=UPI0004986863